MRQMLDAHIGVLYDPKSMDVVGGGLCDGRGGRDVGASVCGRFACLVGTPDVVFGRADRGRTRREASRFRRGMSPDGV